MDARNGLVALAAFLAAGVAIFLAGLFAVSYNGPQAALERQFARSAELAASSAPQLAIADARTLQPSADTGLVLRRMQQELDARTEQLTRQNDLLKENVAAQQLLRRQYAELLQTLEEASEPDPSLASAESELQTEIRQLTEELRQAQLDGGRAAAARDELERRLQEAERRLSELQDTADREIGDLVAVHRARQAAANDALMRLGADAVPILTESLKNPRPEVREWAAMVLGEIGADAGEALRALHEAEADPDPRVRTAATRAIAAIDL